MKKDLDLISGDFFDCDIPKSKRYLWKYFTTDIQRQFVRYYLTFGSIERFALHTGHLSRKRWLQYLLYRYRKLESILAAAKAGFDSETVAQIESGKYEL